MKILRASHMERCIGCYSCALACARLVHRCLSWLHSGIHIRSSGGLSTGFDAQLCLACDPAPCVAVCPTGAFAQRPGGGVKVQRELCIRCGACAEACPVQAVWVDPESLNPIVCIHCGRCTAFCPHDCLEMAEVRGAAETPSLADHES